jgi:hypothetical protein
MTTGSVLEQAKDAAEEAEATQTADGRWWGHKGWSADGGIGLRRETGKVVAAM